ncbi:MAG: FimB/Mfa2 family fimbrial subunit, partial [Rikenellaceae bacterium]|nr:FimB/Mfa2 family fimbrial subunit [Rikenellaceae bacterium]
MSLDFECAEFSDNVGRIDDSAKKTYTMASEDQIKDVTYYVFDSKGVCLSRQFDDNFTGNSKINLVGNDVFTIYAIVNCRSYVEFPPAESMTLSTIENMTVPHRESYESLPFSGKAVVDLVANPNMKSLRIKLTRVNSAIRLVNATDTRINLDSYSIDGLPSEGYLFKAGVPPTVTYNATGKPSNAEGDVYSFHIPVA